MIDVIIVITLAVFAALLALYSMLERNGWMATHIVSAFASSFIMWLITFLFGTGNVGIYEKVLSNQVDTYTYYGSMIETVSTSYTYIDEFRAIIEPWIVYLSLFVSICLTVYFILHVVVWIQDRASMKDMEDEE